MEIFTEMNLNVLCNNFDSPKKTEQQIIGCAQHDQRWFWLVTVQKNSCISTYFWHQSVCKMRCSKNYISKIGKEWSWMSTLAIHTRDNFHGQTNRLSETIWNIYVSFIQLKASNGNDDKTEYVANWVENCVVNVKNVCSSCG